MHNFNIFLSSLSNKNPKKLIVADIDETLVLENGDNSNIEKFSELINSRPPTTLFAYATGRNLNSIKEITSKYKLPKADLMITAVGSEIYHDFNIGTKDCCWDYHIRKKWNLYNIKRTLHNFSGLTLQGNEDQSKTKLSYFTDSNYFSYDYLLDKLSKQLDNITIIHSHNSYLDILPKKASKLKAIEFVTEKLGIKSKNIITCGDSENDLDMLNGSYKSIVVANHTSELDFLKENNNVYFSEFSGAKGVIDGLQKIGFKM